MCFLMILAVIIALMIWQKTNNPVLGLVSVIIVWWLLRFIVTYMVLMALLRPDWEGECDHSIPILSR